MVENSEESLNIDTDRYVMTDDQIIVFVREVSQPETITEDNDADDEVIETLIGFFEQCDLLM